MRREKITPATERIFREGKGSDAVLSLASRDLEGVRALENYRR